MSFWIVQSYQPWLYSGVPDTASSASQHLKPHPHASPGRRPTRHGVFTVLLWGIPRARRILICRAFGLDLEYMPLRLPRIRRHAPAEGEGVVDLGRGDLLGVGHETGHVVIAQTCLLNDESATTVDTKRVVRRSQRIAAVCGLSTG